MPYCKVCGNTESFGSSKTDPVAQYANGPLSGMVADFSHSGEVVRISSLGADKAVINGALNQPQNYFDICLKCGSQMVEW